jgi:predicted acyl esterase
VLIKTHDGATLSATVVRKKGVTQPLPTLLTFDIYAGPAAFRSRGKDAADHGYVGVTADTRGKRLSPDAIVPYEHEAADTGWDGRASPLIAVCAGSSSPGRPCGFALTTRSSVVR